MKLVQETLAIFLQKLPNYCKFSIISFGEGWKYIHREKVQELTDSTRSKANAEIKKFSHNFGGNEILGPLKEAQNKFNNDLNKRIFLLTDGDIDEPDKVFE